LARAAMGRVIVAARGAYGYRRVRRRRRAARVGALVSGGKAPRAAGDYFERRTRDALVADGWTVIRTAGSLGIADLVALRADRDPLTDLVQARRRLPGRNYSGSWIPHAESGGCGCARPATAARVGRTRGNRQTRAGAVARPALSAAARRAPDRAMAPHGAPRSWWREVVTSYPCPMCDAAPGELCRVVEHGPPKHEPHAERSRIASAHHWRTAEGDGPDGISER
jgi:hypothetical protein